MYNFLFLGLDTHMRTRFLSAMDLSGHLISTKAF